MATITLKSMTSMTGWWLLVHLVRARSRLQAVNQICKAARKQTYKGTISLDTTRWDEKKSENTPRPLLKCLVAGIRRQSASQRAAGTLSVCCGQTAACQFQALPECSGRGGAAAR